MKFTELKDKAAGELQELLQTARLRLGQLRFALGSKSLPDNSQLRKTRQEIARIMTALQAQNEKREG